MNEYQAKMHRKACPIMGICHLYILPMELYIGVTQNIKVRFKEHVKFGKNIDRAVILKTFITRKEALIEERRLHELGFKGNKRIN